MAYSILLMNVVGLEHRGVSVMKRITVGKALASSSRMICLFQKKEESIEKSFIQ